MNLNGIAFLTQAHDLMDGTTPKTNRDLVPSALFVMFSSLVLFTAVFIGGVLIQGGMGLLNQCTSILPAIVKDWIDSIVSIAPVVSVFLLVPILFELSLFLSEKTDSFKDD